MVDHNPNPDVYELVQNKYPYYYVHDFLRDPNQPQNIRDLVHKRSRAVGVLRESNGTSYFDKGTVTLITPQLAITAGHCFIDENEDGYIVRKPDGSLMQARQKDSRNYDIKPVGRAEGGLSEEEEKDNRKEVVEKYAERLKNYQFNPKQKEKQEKYLKEEFPDKNEKIEEIPLDEQFNLPEFPINEPKFIIEFDRIEGIPGNRTFSAKLICAEVDDLIDWALVKLEQPYKGIEYTPLSKPTEEEQEIFCLHHPLMSRQRISLGPLRSSDGCFQYKYEALIKAFEGSSGAGILNSEGELILIHVERPRGIDDIRAGYKQNESESYEDYLVRKHITADPNDANFIAELETLQEAGKFPKVITFQHLGKLKVALIIDEEHSDSPRMFNVPIFRIFEINNPPSKLFQDELRLAGIQYNNNNFHTLTVTERLD